MSDEPQVTVTKWGQTVQIPRLLAIEYGLVQPTPEEVAEHARQMAVWEQRWAERNRILDAARTALAAVDEPLTRAVLDLHAEIQLREECAHCLYDDDAHADWPCETVAIVAAHYGIRLPDGAP